MQKREEGRKINLEKQRRKKKKQSINSKKKTYTVRRREEESSRDREENYPCNYLSPCKKKEKRKKEQPGISKTIQRKQTFPLPSQLLHLKN
jgi:hypothetical protein